MNIKFCVKAILLGIYFVSIGQADESYMTETSVYVLSKSKLPSSSHSSESGHSSWVEYYPNCGGHQQSPVSLDSCIQVPLPPLKFSGHWDARPQGFTLHNTGETLMITYPGKVPTLTGGPLNAEYSLGQMHFHWGEDNEGSEHKMGGKLYGMELHMVHYKTDYGSVSNALNFNDGLAVVGLMFKDYHCNNRELNNIVHGLHSVQEGGSNAPLPGHSMTWIEKYLSPENSCGYFTYQGSLTTPPCTETVTWINLKRVSSVGYLQIEEFRSLLGLEDHPILENRRPLQPLNDRKVLCSN